MKNKPIPTAAEFVVIYNSKPQTDSIMVAFAKFHVEEALKQASEKATTYQICNDDDPIIISKGSILNAYPLDNIK